MGEQAAAGAARSPYPDRRARARRLRDRHAFAAEVLTLYLALLDVQEEAHEAARAAPPDPGDLSRRAAGLLPKVVEASVAAGPQRLAETAVSRFHSADLEDLVGRWLRGAEQSLVDRYLARAATAPLLEAMPDAALAGLRSGSSDARHCPRCGGAPQLSYLAPSGEALVTGPRYVVCARCSHAWVYARATCPGCGEAAGARLPIYSESERLPHLRIDACDTCRRYLVTVDLRRDAAAVPLVDELTALPLDLYAKERGLSKVVPNLMGF